MHTGDTTPPFLEPTVERAATAADIHYTAEDSLSLCNNHARSYPRTSRRQRRRNSSGVFSNSFLSPTASLVAPGTICPDVNKGEKDGTEADVALTAWAEPWQGGPPPAPPERVELAPLMHVNHCLELEAGPTDVRGTIPEALSPLSQRTSELVWRDLSLAAAEENGSDSTTRGADCRLRSPLRERDAATGVFTPSGSTQRGSMSGGMPAMGRMADFSFAVFSKSISAFFVSADNSVQDVTTVRERVNCELPPVLRTENSINQSSPIKPHQTDNGAMISRNGSILMDSESTSRDGSLTNRTARRERRVSFTGEWRV
ncbi:hypothetical protein STCU_09924 [Strigomonas culicis]|uniref:Uncharacterized protein n=1 Tax=Strigomonas culicis TaxID=28005 RepID=S9TJV1_9TRYP|nr:hypothetical protein STCU_09924 [Strigomonas culicis]|eukprot:EPY18427.1 hypothetical protein STCU_09924 [Strigomonas culicis]